MLTKGILCWICNHKSIIDNMMPKWEKKIFVMKRIIFKQTYNESVIIAFNTHSSWWIKSACSKALFCGLIGMRSFFCEKYRAFIWNSPRHSVVKIQSTVDHRKKSKTDMRWFYLKVLFLKLKFFISLSLPAYLWITKFFFFKLNKVTSSKHKEAKSLHSTFTI
jgi:hypothetical protein